MEQILLLLKLDLGITSTVKDPYFDKLIESSISELESKGIMIDTNNTEDVMLVSDYSAWKYRKRQENAPISENIKSRIRDRIVKARSGSNVF